MPLERLDSLSVSLTDHPSPVALCSDARGHLAGFCGHSVSCPLTWLASPSTSSRKCPCARSTPSDEGGPSVLFPSLTLHPLLEYGVFGFSSCVT